jgi:hypothetical protein
MSRITNVEPKVLQSVPTASPARRVLRLIGGALVIASSLLAWCLLSYGPPSLAQTAKGAAQGASKADAAASQSKGQPLLPAQIRYGTAGLPQPVLDLREALQAAVEAGEIGELAQTYAESHIRPDIGAAPGADPAAHWKRVSGDGQGREVLAALSLILEAGYAEIRRGADIENNKLYVWPYFAEMPLSKLTPRQEVELLRLVPASTAREMKAKGRYTHWRLVIGADGTWHALRKGD